MITKINFPFESSLLINNLLADLKNIFNSSFYNLPFEKKLADLFIKKEELS